MKNSTLLGLGIGMVVGAFLVDTFQPAQDLVDSCKSKLKANAKSISKQAKHQVQELVD
jgi:hypothetical protein